MNVKLKMSILAAAVLAVASAHATGASTPAVSVGVNGSATSGVSGSTSSYTNVNNVNQAAVHGSFAKSFNTTTVGGSVTPGTNGASVDTHAVSVGGTTTGAFGYNLSPGSNGLGAIGAASAGAVQYGYGNVEASAVKANGNVKYDVNAKSNVAVGTFSTANVVNSGAALSGSLAGAANVSHANVQAVGNATTLANGYTAGVDGALTWGMTLGNDETVTAGGALELSDGTPIASFQGGSYGGQITKTFTQTGNVTVPGDHPSHPDTPNNPPKDDEHPKPPKKGNNGWGNGDQDAPGNSGGNNNAENGPGRGKGPKNGR